MVAERSRSLILVFGVVDVIEPQPVSCGLYELCFKLEYVGRLWFYSLELRGTLLREPLHRTSLDCYFANRGKASMFKIQKVTSFK